MNITSLNEDNSLESRITKIGWSKLFDHFGISYKHRLGVYQFHCCDKACFSVIFSQHNYFRWNCPECGSKSGSNYVWMIQKLASKKYSEDQVVSKILLFVQREECKLAVERDKRARLLMKKYGVCTTSNRKTIWDHTNE